MHSGEELAVEVPDRQAVGGRIELRCMCGSLPAQRIEVGDQVAPYPVHVDQLVDLGLLLEQRCVAVDGLMSRRHFTASYGTSIDRKTSIVEVVFAEQQLVDLLQEHARLGALDDPVVVCRRDRDHLRDPESASVAGSAAWNSAGKSMEPTPTIRP